MRSQLLWCLHGFGLRITESPFKATGEILRKQALSRRMRYGKKESKIRDEAREVLMCGRFSTGPAGGDKSC